MAHTLTRSFEPAVSGRMARRKSCCRVTAVQPSRGFARQACSPSALIRIAFATTVLVGFGLGMTSRQATARSETTAPISLDTLVAKSETIFVGEVLRSKSATVRREDGLATRLTFFSVAEVLKGSLAAGNEFALREFAPLATNFEPHESVVLFLPPPSEAGFTSPGLSGYFRIKPLQSDPGQLFAKNLVDNRALWSNQGQLWSPEKFPLSDARTFLKSRHPGLEQSGPMLSPERIEAILAIGNEACRPRPIPLELLLSATHARLSTTSGSTKPSPPRLR
jgi:hypothetical protein